MNMPDLELHLITDIHARAERSDAVANRVRILSTAEKLFLERGVAFVNMAEIAKTARVGQGTLYRHFANKGELCHALMDKQMVDFQNRVIDELNRFTLNKTPKISQLHWFIDSLIGFNDSHTALLCEAQMSIYHPSQTRPQPYVWIHMTIAGLLRGAMLLGEIQSHHDVQVLADVILAPLQPSVFRLMRDANNYELNRIRNTMHDMIGRI
jgi:AcrR family transcriptional regulator